MKKADKTSVINSVAYELQQSGFRIRKPADIGFVAISPNTTQETLVIVHTDKMPLDEVRSLENEAYKTGRSTSHVFYKDGKNFFIRVADNEALRIDKSFKRHADEINDILNLRKLEKHAASNLGGILAYFQPTTERLEKGLRLYRAGTVTLDYSHLPANHIAQKNHGNVSLDYKIAREIQKEDASVITLTPQGKYAILNYGVREPALR